MDEEEGETLINVNMVDDETADRFVEHSKKKADYNPYDAGDIDEYGMVRQHLCAMGGGGVYENLNNIYVLKIGGRQKTNLMGTCMKFGWEIWNVKRTF